MSLKSVQHHSLITALLLLLLLAAVMLPTTTAQKNSCHNHHCYNGGTVLMPATVFSNCRCKCAPNFTGPQCRIRSATHPPTYNCCYYTWYWCCSLPDSPQPSLLATTIVAGVLPWMNNYHNEVGCMRGVYNMTVW
jgi:hypothetical protein